MVDYIIKATETGLTLNYEYITKSAIASFSNAFPLVSDKPVRGIGFTHPGEVVNYPPTVASIVSAYAEGEHEAFAVASFDDEFAKNFDGDDSVSVSVYSKCTSHWDDRGLRVIDTLEYDPMNGIDIVWAGAVPTAQVVGQVEDSATPSGENSNKPDDFIRLSLSVAPKKVEPRKDVEMEKTDIIDAVKEAMGEEVISDAVIDRIASAVGSSVSAATPAEPEPTNEDVGELIADAFRQGAASGLEGKSIDRVADSISNGIPAKDAIESEKEIVAEITERVADSKEVTSSGIHAVGGSKEVISNARDLMLKGV